MHTAYILYIYIWVSLKMVCYRKLFVKAKGVPFNLHWAFFSSQVLKEFVQDDLAILEGLLQKTAPIHTCALTSILAPPICPNLDEMASTDLTRPLLLPRESFHCAEGWKVKPALGFDEVADGGINVKNCQLQTQLVLKAWLPKFQGWKRPAGCSIGFV